jgi:hypothetical protein
MKRRGIAFALILAAVVAQMGCSTAAQHPAVSEPNSVSRLNWPLITEFHEKFHFDAVISRKFKRTILSSSGTPLYILDARIPSDGDPDEGYDYSGVFDCRLYSIRGNDDGYPTLFQNVRNATADWETDGRFLSTELGVLVGANPSRVILQRSKMRGMAIVNCGLHLPAALHRKECYHERVVASKRMLPGKDPDWRHQCKRRLRRVRVPSWCVRFASDTRRLRGLRRPAFWPSFAR